ncbi:hypothetical protein DL93DRAFT_2091120 [Clavulina sp. PMI_390]|nr:hypothetical protein DL93DRAFT_2091120 [Clavulina sp. PMI_390]
MKGSIESLCQRLRLQVDRLVNSHERRGFDPHPFGDLLESLHQNRDRHKVATKAMRILLLDLFTNLEHLGAKFVRQQLLSFFGDYEKAPEHFKTSSLLLGVHGLDGLYAHFGIWLDRASTDNQEFCETKSVLCMFCVALKARLDGLPTKVQGDSFS